MNWVIALTLVLHLAVTRGVATGACPESRAVRCESWYREYRECVIGEATSIVSVKMTKQLSDSNDQCFMLERFGGTYGFYDNILWVSRNCRADFEICYNPGSCPAIREIKCESWRSSIQVKCHISEAKRIKSVSVRTQLSGPLDRCKYNMAYGFVDNTLWVGYGCRAVFLLCFDPVCPNSVPIKCESLNWERKECLVSGAATITAAFPKKIYSGLDSCTKDGTFGWIDNTLWVDSGCRADFTVCYETSTCSNNDIMKCNSVDSTRVECPIASTAVITHASVSKINAGNTIINCYDKDTFGWQGNKLWVDKGCQADFSICYKDEGTCPAQKMATCESSNKAYVECQISEVKSIVSVTPTKQLSGSDGACILDKSYGYFKDKLWVNDGCAAEFDLCYNRVLKPGVCPKKKEVECKSFSSAYSACEIAEAGAITWVNINTQQSSSDNECTFDKTYGFYDNKLWVDEGCSGIFTACYYPGIGPCINKVRKTCESFNGKYERCEIAGAARVTAVGVRKLLGGNCSKDNFGMVVDNIWVFRNCRAEFDVCYEPPASSGDTTVKKHKWCYKDYPILDGLLCYEACRSGYAHKGGGPLCWASCPSRTINFGLFCTKKSYGRGVGKPLSTCGAAQDKDGLLCYPDCRSGYSGVGPVCWQRCRSGYTDDGALCRRNAHIYGRNVGSCPWHDKCGLCGGPWYNICGRRRKCGGSCRSGYKNDGCTCRRDVHIYAKNTYGRGVGDPMGCKADEEKDGALCYPRCDSGYNGVGPVCWATCSGETIDTGAQCQKKAYGRGVGKVINCLKTPKLSDVTNSSGLVTIMKSVEGIQTLQGAACSHLYFQIQFWVTIAETFNNCHKKDEWTTISIAYGAGGAIGVEVSGEVGLAVNIKLGKGICFVGYCSGIKTDVSIGAEIVFGYWRRLDDIPGKSKVVEVGVDIPFTELGISAVFVINPSGDYIGTEIALGIGVGILPFEIGFSICNTPEGSIVHFDM